MVSHKVVPESDLNGRQMVSSSLYAIDGIYTNIYKETNIYDEYIHKNISTSPLMC